MDNNYSSIDPLLAQLSNEKYSKAHPPLSDEGQVSSRNPFLSPWLTSNGQLPIRKKTVFPQYKRAKSQAIYSTSFSIYTRLKLILCQLYMCLCDCLKYKMSLYPHIMGTQHCQETV